jgi:hypothetical protein
MARLVHRCEMRFGQFRGGKLFLAQRVTRLDKRKRGKVDHPALGSSQKYEFRSDAGDGPSFARAVSLRIGTGCTAKAPNRASTASGSSGFNKPWLSK